jgi:hypothetical protein
MQDPSLMPHQEMAVGELRNGNILKGGVGSGKTRTGLAYYVAKGGAPWTSLIVITTAKKRDTGDWQHEASLWGVEVTVDSWNNLPLYMDRRDHFFIFDEQRVVGSGVWVKAFTTLAKHNQWILLSATPGDTWLDYIPVFVANGFYKNRTDFLRDHVVYSRFAKFPKVERIYGTQKLARLLQSILVEMPYERHTVRHETEIYADYDKELYNTVWRKRWNFIEERPIRSTAELFSLLRAVINTHPSRLELIRDLLIKHPRLIVFYNFDYELEALRTLDVVTREWNGHRHDPLPDGDEWLYLVQYMAGAEGWDCVQTDSMAFYSPSYSYRMTEQAMGRIDRLNTPFTDLYYYFLKSACALDLAIFRTLARKEEFNQTKFLKEAKGT